MNPLKNLTRPDLGLFLIRLMVGTVLLYHGSGKLFGAFGGPGLDGFAGWLGSLNIPMPMVSAFLAASAEFFGGLGILLGLWIRWTALPAAFTMLVAAFTAHSGFDGQQGGMEYPLTLAFVLIGLALTGSGRLTFANFLPQSPADLQPKKSS
jgi:putative oxidoreductase